MPKSETHLLHLDSVQSSSTGTDSGAQSISLDDIPASFSGATRTNSTVVFGTAIVLIKDAWDRTHAVCVLLDSGSQISDMTSDCLARLGLPKRRFQSDIVGLAQSPVAQVQGIISGQFSSYFDAEYVFPTAELVILSQITAAMPSARLPLKVRHQYCHLLLADKDFDISARIDVLFGADIFPSLVRPNAGLEHHSGFLSALDTKLAWIIVRSFPTPNATPLVALTTTVDRSISDQFQRFWTVEEPAAPTLPTTDN